jgi:hypothetical protein
MVRYLIRRTQYEEKLKDWEIKISVPKRKLVKKQVPSRRKKERRRKKVEQTIENVCEQDEGVDIFVEEEIEWDLDDLIGLELIFEEDKWQEALLKARKLIEKSL